VNEMLHEMRLDLWRLQRLWRTANQSEPGHQTVYKTGARELKSPKADKTGLDHISTKGLSHMIDPIV
jgi:hypothetical protein